MKVRVLRSILSRLIVSDGVEIVTPIGPTATVYQPLVGAEVIEIYTIFQTLYDQQRVTINTMIKQEVKGNQ